MNEAAERSRLLLQEEGGDQESLLLPQKMEASGIPILKSKLKPERAKLMPFKISVSVTGWVIINAIASGQDAGPYTGDGSIDIKGCPASKRTTGNWRACFFILGDFLGLVSYKTCPCLFF
ncbi:hypothetical protein PR202_gb19147 [Eleusine coracana subsp. coracana]|uniref:Uncharacterized protein n=1 Tax=Eleusine coracana subsp. coracana TaxID=191504 RepID=A0AAV5F926_ELECO|nr:hypothetical protein PR202_gb19147 [Eleusine coracana subsp. coracana]